MPRNCFNALGKTTLQTLNVPFKKQKKGWEFEGPVLFFLDTSCALRAMRTVGFNIDTYFPVFAGGLPSSKLFQPRVICDAYIGYMDVCSIDFVQHVQLDCQKNYQHGSSSSSIHVQLHIQSLQSFGLPNMPKQRPAHVTSVTAASRLCNPFRLPACCNTPKMASLPAEK